MVNVPNLIEEENKLLYELMDLLETSNKLPKEKLNRAKDILGALNNKAKAASPGFYDKVYNLCNLALEPNGASKAIKAINAAAEATGSVKYGVKASSYEKLRGSVTDAQITSFVIPVILEMLQRTVDRSDTLNSHKVGSEITPTMSTRQRSHSFFGEKAKVTFVPEIPTTKDRPKS